MIGYTYFDWGGGETDGRRTTEECFSLGSSIVSGIGRKQEPISLSSVEVEYVVASEVCQKFVWLRNLLSNFFEGPLSPKHIHCDNESCIRLIKDPVCHARTKNLIISTATSKAWYKIRFLRCIIYL